MTTIPMIIVALFFIVFFLVAFGLTQKGNVKRIKEAEAEITKLRKRVLFLEDPEATETVFDWDFKI